MDKLLSLAPAAKRAKRVPATESGVTAAATVARAQQKVELGLATCRLWRRVAPADLCEELLTWAKGRPVELQQRPVVVAGRECMQNRLTGTFADSDDLDYGYSGIKTVPTVGLTPAMARAKALVEQLTGEAYNLVLVNLYEPHHTIGAHADDERDLEAGTGIASLSVGAFRDFDVHPIAAPADGGQRKRIVRLPLGGGDVLHMPSVMQKHYKHSITRKAHEGSGVRLSLTFRRVRRI